MGQILLVRHGQASWGAEDYDVLSDVGWEQSRVLGRSLAARGVAASFAVRGGMRRHRETAEAVAEGLDLPEPVLDHGWDEFDHQAMLALLPTPWEGEPSPAEFQAWFETSTDRWTDGEHDDYAESFDAFSERVRDGLRRTTEAADGGTAIVITSGGPMSAVTAALLGVDLDRAGRVRLWRRLNPVVANCGVTKLVTGRRGTTLVSINDHSALEPTPGLITYR